MEESLRSAIEQFMSYLSTVNDLHNSNDKCRLYNIALEAVKIGHPVPRDEMKELFEKAIEEQGLNKTVFNDFYLDYIGTVEIAHDVIERINSKNPIPSDFRF